MTEVLNWRKARENLDDSEEILIELAQVFVEECAPTLRQIRIALDEHDLATLRRMTHSLKSSAQLFIATPAAEAARRLEVMAQSGDLSRAEDAWKTLCREIDSLKAALAERLRDSHG